MDIADIEHVAIRNRKFISLTTIKPEIDVFVQTHTSRTPIKELHLAPDQTIWMKWTGGPIVAKASILTWHSGKFQNGNINEMRDLTKSTRLWGENKYWESVQNKKNSYYTILFLRDSKWLDSLIHPDLRSYQQSWFVLDTIEKKKLWLTNNEVQQYRDNNQKGRNIPAGKSFDVKVRDKFTCHWCSNVQGKHFGEEGKEIPFAVDHIIPWEKVKEHEMFNLVFACRNCNAGKSNKKQTHVGSNRLCTICVTSHNYYRNKLVALLI